MIFGLYSYLLEAKVENATFLDNAPEIKEFISADSTVDAYKKVLEIVDELNKSSSVYQWYIRQIYNCYFEGVDEDTMSKSPCNCDCEHEEKSLSRQIYDACPTEEELDMMDKKIDEMRKKITNNIE